MKFNIKMPFKGTLALSALALIMTSSAFAIPRAPCDRASKACCEEPPPGPFAFSFPEDIGLACPKDVFVDLDFLAMQAKEEGLEYAISDNNATTGQFPVTGSVQDFSRTFRDWDWNIGFRVGLGLLVSRDQWSLAAHWTHVNITDSTSSHTTNGNVLIPLWLGPTTAVGATNVRASAKWSADFNTIDLALGKPYHVSRYFVLEPHIGLRGAWINQDYEAKYDGTFGSVTNGRMTASNDYWGVGLRAGAQTTFVLASGWSLFGRTAGSFLFSEFDVTQNEPNPAHGYNITDEFYTNSFNWELAAGIAWGIKFNKSKNYFGLKLAYEFQQWLDQNRMRKFFGTVTAGTIPNDTVSRGDLTLNGISLRAIFDF